MLKNKNKLFWFLAFILIGIYSLIKLNSGVLTSSLYQNGRIDLLNKVTGVSGAQTLDFYIGRAQETLWGPACEVISGLLFMAFALLYLKESSAKVFGLAVFLYLIATRPEALFFPPYGDAIGGPFAEALWLAGHSFDYTGLFYQPGYALGGPKVYFTSIYPTFLALLLKFIPFVKAFLFVNHIIVFALAAAIVAVFRQILLKVFDRGVAALAAILLLSLPLFLSQAEAINMEMPSLFFAMLSALYLAQRKMPMAAFMAVLAVLVKEACVITCAAVFVAGLMIFWQERHQRASWKILGWSVFALLFAVGKVKLKVLLHDQHANMMYLFAGWPSLRWSFIISLYIASLIAVAAKLSGDVISRFKDKKDGAFSFFQRYGVVSVMFVNAGLWFALFLNFNVVSPRYRLLLCPFLVFCIVYAIIIFIRKDVVQRAVLLGMLAVSFFSVYGLFYKPLADDNNHVLLERSLEYRNDLALNIRLAKELEKNFLSLTVGAPFILAQILAIPELGYVQKPLNVMMYGMICTYGGIKNFCGLRNVNIAKTIWVGYKGENPDEKLFFPGYPISNQDKVVKEIMVGNKKLSLFFGGGGIDMVWVASQMIDWQRRAGQEAASLRGIFKGGF